MTTRNRILTATTLFVIVAGLVYLIAKPKGAKEPTAPSSMPASAPENSAHELASLEESLQKSPDHVPILLRLAELKHKAGETAQATAHLRAAVKAEPKNVEARLELGKLLFESKDIDGAIQETNEILKIDPKNVDALYNIGAIYGNLGKDGLAREYWSRAIVAAPDSESGRKAKSGLQQLTSVPPVSLPTGH
ncbi:MAG: tetratricopeptide repeat protein, partial [Acidobacteriota bacterium]